ncbi:MAG TPA: hypothetical protein VNA68_00100 [Candidatus Dormibacteraeota bacterium]|nr:hypothetical protein [Candidatus Dormibacteraeota bacterium]
MKLMQKIYPNLTTKEERRLVKLCFCIFAASCTVITLFILLYRLGFEISILVSENVIGMCCAASLVFIIYLAGMDAKKASQS